MRTLTHAHALCKHQASQQEIVDALKECKPDHQQQLLLASLGSLSAGLHATSQRMARRVAHLAPTLRLHKGKGRRIAIVGMLGCYAIPR